MLSDIRFQDFEDVLAMAGSLADAAEAHGSLCGALGPMSPYKMQDWINEILPGGGGLSGDRNFLGRAGDGIRTLAAGRRTAAQRPCQCAGVMVQRIPLWLGDWTYFRPRSAERRCRRDRARFHGNLPRNRR